MDVFEMEEIDLALGEQVKQGLITQAERERLVRNMAEGMPGGATAERAPWKKRAYVLQLVGVEEKPNRFFHTEESLRAKYQRDPDGELAPGVPYWEKDDGKKDAPSFPYQETQLALKFEVLEGEKKSDWWFLNFVDRGLRFTDEGWKNPKLAPFLFAAAPDFDPWKLIGGKPNNTKAGYRVVLDKDDFEHFRHVPVNASLTPKDDGKYADAGDFWPVDEGYKPKEIVPPNQPTEFVPPSPDDDEIPF